MSALEDHIAIILQSEASSSAVSEVLAQAEAELKDIDTRRAEAKARSLDPLSGPAAVKKARADLDELAFRTDRLGVAVERLKEQLTAARAREAETDRRAAYALARAERDAAADQLRTRYPILADELAEILSRVIKADADVARVNANRPAGEEHLQAVEQVARGILPNGMFIGLDGSSTSFMGQHLTKAVRLPAFEATNRGRVWPPSNDTSLLLG